MTLAVAYNAPMPLANIRITTPTSLTTYATKAGVVGIAGTASDNVACSKLPGATTAAASGLANGTTTWSAAISLQAGLNNITVTGP